MVGFESPAHVSQARMYAHRNTRSIPKGAAPLVELISLSGWSGSQESEIGGPAGNASVSSISTGNHRLRPSHASLRCERHGPPTLCRSVAVANPPPAKVLGLKPRRSMADNGQRVLFGLLSGMFVAHL